MRATPVTPIAKPITALRKFGSLMRPNAGLEGCSSKAVTLAAAIMKIPSNAPSMRNSGQCDWSDYFIFAHALLKSPRKKGRDLGALAKPSQGLAVEKPCEVALLASPFFP